MFEILRYAPEHEAKWNAFVARSKNGTFLFDRRYMDYHADRFEDFSLMFFCKGRLRALLPANGKTDADGQRVLVSHGGLTYGGLVMDGQLRAAETCELFAELQLFLRGEGVRKMTYRPVPWIYCRQPAEEDLYALTKVCGAKLTAREISSTIDLRERIGFSELRRRGAKKARKQGVVVEGFERGSDKRTIALTGFWEILNANLNSRYGVAPVHTVTELQMLMERFPENIRLFTVNLGDAVLGGALCFVCGLTVHIQYISASPEGKNLGVLDLLFEELITNVFAACHYFDFGKSTEQAGAFLNERLISQKEGFGARGVCYDTYEIQME